MIGEIKNKVKSMIQWGRVAKAIVDSGVDQVAQVESTGSKPFQVVLVYPYGISANAPPNANVLQMNIGGSGKAKAGIPTMMENRFRDLKEWEVKVGNFLSKSHVFFDENGEILLNPTQDSSSDWAVQFTALKTAFEELQDAFNEHTHPGSSSASGGPVTCLAPSVSTPPEPSTGNIDAAKVEKVRMP